MTPDYCRYCWNNPITEPYILELIGQATSQDLSKPHHKEAEEATINQNIHFYHYFMDSAEIFNKIKTMLTIGSKAHCKCNNCLSKSMNSDNPHYGDGAYGTLNDSFSPMTDNDSVTGAHGLNFFYLPFRAVVLLKKSADFIKFAKTGGVLRSIPKRTLTRFELLMLEPKQGQVIRIEKWNGNDWVPIGRYEPC